MKEKIEILKQSPIFAFTRASTEVAHSNFWHWLIDLDKNFIRVFFPNADMNDFGEHFVKREQKNRDLTIWNKSGKALVVENKIKDLPRLEQLEEYQAKLASEFAGGVITGIIKPDFIANKADWNFVDYKTIANNISTIANTLNLTDKQKMFITEYVENVIGIYEILTELANESDSMDLTSCNQLEEIKFADVAKKLRASMFKHYLELNITDDSKKLIEGTDWEFRILQGFGQDKNPYVDARFVKGDKVLGIQIEGSSFERCIQDYMGDIKNLEKQTKELFEKAVLINWFQREQTSEDKKHFIFDKETNMRISPNYCRHKSENAKYIKLYQHYTIKDFSFKALADEILENLIVASEIIKKGLI